MHVSLPFRTTSHGGIYYFLSLFLTERAPVSLSSSRDSTFLSRCSIIACACSAFDIFCEEVGRRD